MSKRRYTNMQVLLPTIEKMLESGKNHREIEAELGLEGDRPVHNLLKRQRKKAAKGAPKFRGRKLQRRCRNISMRISGSRWK